VAKNDSYSTRGSTFVDDDTDDAYLRRPQAPAASSSSRSRAARGTDRDLSRDQMADRLLDKAAEGINQRIDEDAPFVRTRRRAPIKKGILPDWARTRWGRMALVAAGLVVLAGVILVILSVRNFLESDPRFRIDEAADIQTMGNSELSRADLLSVFGSDIGRNIFYVPLAARRAELEQIPWVQHATVMRTLPNELRVAIQERTPIAFVRVRDRVQLVDADGVVLDMSPAMMAAKHFSFPVVTGINPGDPLSTRQPRMRMYQKFVAELDAGGERLSTQMSEIDLSDPEDVRATVPAAGSDLLLHLGEENFLARYRVYQAHLKEWEQQYPRLAAVDLRYDGQVVLKMSNGRAADGNAAAAADAPAASTPDAKPAIKPALKPAPVKKHAPPHAKHARKATR
jgi:cell division protein FtsQ